MKSDTSVSASKCIHCDKEFKYESEKRRHELSHVPQFECKVCLKKFSFVSALRRHEKQHERTQCVQCSKCGRRFRDESLLKRHIEYAHRGSHKCKECSAILHSKLALRTHMKTHRPESERKFRCSYDGCGKTFNFTHHLKHHELTHTDDKPHVCMECGKRFIQRHHLKIHERVHQPDSWLPCPVVHCHKEFSNEYALRRHITTHKNTAAELKVPRVGKLIEKIMTGRKKTGRKESEKTETDHEKLCAHLPNNPSEINSKQEINVAIENSCNIENFTDIVDMKSLDVKFEVLDMVTTGTCQEFCNKIDTGNENAELDHEKLCAHLPNNPSEINSKQEINVAIENSCNIENFTDIVDMKSLDVKFEVLDMVTTGTCQEFCNKIDTGNENAELDDIELSTSNCTSIIGKCLVTGDSETNESCLCAQISTKTASNQIQETISPNNYNASAKLIDDLKCLEKRLKDVNACESCECASTCEIRNTGNSLENVVYENPKLEKRNDNIVKIKDTFDIDFGDIANYENDIDENNLDSKTKFSIMNSCRDILGNCIVSGDGTIGEGCLCAKMTVNNQQVIAQEIEEITPCPKTS